MGEFREAVVIAEVFANEFHRLCKSFRTPRKDSDARINLLTARSNERILDFLERIKNCIENRRCDAQSFTKQVIKMNSFKLLEIEIWWYQLRCGIMNQEDFFDIFDSDDLRHITHYFCECLYRNIFLESVDSSLRKNMNSDLIEILLNHKDGCNTQETESPAYSYFLKSVVSQNIMQKRQNMNFDSLIEILKMSSVKDSVIKSFLLDFIEAMLEGEPISLGTVLKNNENFLKNEKVTVARNLKIFHLLKSQEIINHLKQLLKSSWPIHCQNLFSILSILIIHCEDNLKHLKALILYLLEDALKNFKRTSLLYVFILSRQCSFPQRSTFPSYLNWFSSTFSVESSRPINTTEKAIFFMDFLNETVQFDSPYYLKVHINRTPCLPLDCQSLLSDYVKLVKTRLIDLNESVELGLFDNVTSKTSAEFDVETVLKIYSCTKQVPNCVLEASLFCKLYYEKKFLVTLLSKYEGKSSVRHKLITKLQALGKIPNSLYLAYKQLM